jgi:hypothetical protein
LFFLPFRDLLKFGLKKGTGQNATNTLPAVLARCDRHWPTHQSPGANCRLRVPPRLYKQHIGSLRCKVISWQYGPGNYPKDWLPMYSMILSNQ